MGFSRRIVQGASGKLYLGLSDKRINGVRHGKASEPWDLKATKAKILWKTFLRILVPWSSLLGFVRGFVCGFFGAVWLVGVFFRELEYYFS